jgi:ankyrin repeat protein
LDSGADTNAPLTDRYYARERERTTLQDAAQRNNTELIKILLRAHADINAPATGEYGRTALQAAAQNGNTEIVRILLDAGADANVPAGP